MTVSYEEIFNEFSAEQQERILRRAAEIEAEINLRELRRLRRLTQARLSKTLKIGQEGISRIEKRSDLYISTLRSYVEGVGGKLSLVVEFPDQAPVILAGLGMDEDKPRQKSRRTGSAILAVKPKGKTKAELKSSTKSGAKLRKSA